MRNEEKHTFCLSILQRIQVNLFVQNFYNLSIQLSCSSINYGEKKMYKSPWKKIIPRSHKGFIIKLSPRHSRIAHIIMNWNKLNELFFLYFLPFFTLTCVRNKTFTATCIIKWTNPFLGLLFSSLYKEV